MKDKGTFLFEVSWEVCNKVGGIYTVIHSKLGQVKAEFGDRYCLIGPWLETNDGFVEERGPDTTNITGKLREAGIGARVGRWDTPERPRVVLVRYQGVLDQSKLLYQLWEDYGVDSMTGGWDYLEPVLFSTVAGKAIEALSGLYADHQLVAQFHEWIAGAGLLYLKKKAPSIATVFTTHATVLGRSLAGNGVELYQRLESLNTDEEAVRFNVVPKHTLEGAAARAADCFTTVSGITALEAQHLLNVVPDEIVPNGFPVKQVPEFDIFKERARESRRTLLKFGEQFLKKELAEDQTLIISTSGRYEFHNKGIDVLLDALGQLGQDPASLPKQILAYLFVIAGASPVTPGQWQPDRHQGLATHPLWSPKNDPIVTTCQRLGLTNEPDSKVNVIFVPVYLAGQDGALNLDYYTALAGCDLTVYPSYYEPWGYTPLESIAYWVPTVSTDQAGFGKWILDQHLEQEGIRILRRLEGSHQDAVGALRSVLVEAAAWDRAHLDKVRSDLRPAALQAEWELFFSHYKKAFAVAVEECQGQLTGKAKKLYPGQSYRGADSPRPRFRQFSVKSSVPERIARLRELAYNLWWGWNPEGHELFSRLDPVLYEQTGYNPVRLIEAVNPARLTEMADNEAFLGLYDSVMKQLDRYMQSQSSLLKKVQDLAPERPVAYFSMEYGLHECLPIYSGGLGVLSGDHIKSASDVNLPLVGIGLLYKHGYFRQGISKEGDQKVEYFHNDFFRMPVQEVRKQNVPVVLALNLPGRTVLVKVWKIQAGRIPVYMLDTDIQENTPSDRTITAKLYQGDKRVRIEQEIILGIGGIRLLEELNIHPSVYHLNEGHSAFLIIERLIRLVTNSQLDTDTAKELIKASTVFTTHTPVPAGNEAFDLQLVENYLKDYAQANGLSWDEVVEMGHKKLNDAGPFEMTVLALKHSCRRNGVSKLHGLVSRRMWSELWPGLLMQEIPIQYITNGVHVGTWLTTEMKNLLVKYCSLNIEEALLKKGEWKKVQNIPDAALWQTHLQLKNRLVNTVKKKVTDNWNREGEDPGLLERFLNTFGSAPLTLGFARRFATYKRATLFLKDFDRIRKLVTNPKYPVQFVFAGKAHPDDQEAFGLIKQIASLAKHAEFLGRIVFVEGYNIRLARRMISGVDVWLNNPRRPQEASGTSGQKAGINGVLNVSVLDGWWDEGYDGTNGWALGSRQEFKNTDTQDRSDSESLYDLLENDLLPAYYQNNSSGLPEKWVRMMKRSLLTLIPEYNTHRMLQEYTQTMYLPAVRRYEELAAADCRKARQIAEWRKSIRARFPSLHIVNVATEGITGDTLNMDDEIIFHLELDRGRLATEEIDAQVVVTQAAEEDILGYHEPPQYFDEEFMVVPMAVVEEKDGTVAYTCRFKAKTAGKFNYGIRVLPHHPDLDDVMDLNLVYWG